MLILLIGNADNYVKGWVGECGRQLCCYLTIEAKDKLTFAQEAFEDKKG
jgi:sulfite reductase (ferredoxin)